MESHASTCQRKIKTKMEKFPNQKDLKPATLADVAREAEVLKMQLAPQGANDYEFPTIDAIVQSVASGEISPEEGLDRLTKIKESKQEK